MDLAKERLKQMSKLSSPHTKKKEVDIKFKKIDILHRM